MATPKTNNFMHGVDYNAWFENRRTGYPYFKLNSSTNLNNPNTMFPKRWLYPISEINYNGEHLTEAVTRQYGGSDNTSGEMWILK